jgi:lysophospholipase L1-like esterase
MAKRAALPQAGCMTNNLRVRIAAVLVGLAMVIGFVSPSVAGASHRDDRPGGYLALGDSVTFGYSPLLEDPWIPERFVGYPELIEQRTGMPATNLGCPGQTAQALVSRAALDNGCFDFRDFAREEGITVLHADYDGTQLEAALAAVRSSTPPSLISIQGGGNDMTICGEADDPESCLDATVPKVTASLGEVVSQLRAAGYRGRIVLVGYHLVPGLEDPLRRINRAVEQAARHGDAAFAEVAGPLERYARRNGGDLCRAGLLVALPDGSCDLHPTLVGQGIVADAVLDAAYGHHRRYHDHGPCSNHGDRGWSDHESRGARGRHGRHER